MLPRVGMIHPFSPKCSHFRTIRFWTGHHDPCKDEISICMFLWNYNFAHWQISIPFFPVPDTDLQMAGSSSFKKRRPMRKCEKNPKTCVPSFDQKGPPKTGCKKTKKWQTVHMKVVTNSPQWRFVSTLTDTLCTCKPIGDVTIAKFLTCLY